MNIIERLFVPVMIVAGLIVLFLIIRVLIKVAKRVMLAISRYANATSSDYEDEITSILDTDSRPSVIRRLRNLSIEDERKMTPTERIRFRYKRLMKSHRYWAAGSTARENLPTAAAELYEQARYTEKPVSEQDAQAFIEEIKQVK